MDPPCPPFPRQVLLASEPLDSQIGRQILRVNYCCLAKCVKQPQGKITFVLVHVLRHRTPESERHSRTNCSNLSSEVVRSWAGGRPRGVAWTLDMRPLMLVVCLCNVDFNCLLVTETELYSNSSPVKNEMPTV